MGLTLVEALENLLAPRSTRPGVRMFARSIIQGESLGVSTGQIMRNLAIELRKRRRAYAEERAQKAPVKILFPILFLIMPALFIVLLLPVMIKIMDVLWLAGRRAPRPEPDAAPRGRPGRRRVGHRRRLDAAAAPRAARARATCRRGRASCSARPGRSTPPSCASRSTSSSSTPTRS